MEKMVEVVLPIGRLEVPAVQLIHRGIGLVQGQHMDVGGQLLGGQSKSLKNVGKTS